MEYYISVGTDKRGPYSLEELKARGITSETLVMAENSDQWVPAWQVEELRDIIRIPKAPTAEPIQKDEPAVGQPINNNQGDSPKSNPEDLHVEATPLDDPFQHPVSNETQNFQQGRPVVPPSQPTEQKKGGGCLRGFIIFLIIVAVLAGIAVVTCPDERAHKAVLTNVVSSAITDEALGEDSTADNSDVVSKMFRQMSDSWTKEVVAAAVDNLIHVDNHILFSTGKVRFAGKENTVSVGVFGHVFTVDKDDLRKAAENYYSKAEQDVKENLKKKASQMFNDNVVAPAEQAIEDAVKSMEDEVKHQLGDTPWPFGDGSNDEPSDSTSDSQGI